MGVTKTDFMRGMQCPRMLWLDKYHPEEKIIPPEVQARFDQGNEFGDKAMGMFGPYTEVTTMKEDGRLDYRAMINKTNECLLNNVDIICEGSFSWYGHYCAVDILRRVEGGHDMYEVKDSPQVSEQFIKDIAFQRYLAIKCGVKVKRCFIVYHGEDENDPFVIEEVTEKVREYFHWINDNIFRLSKIKQQDEEVIVPMGEQCDCPYECFYKDFCKKR